MVFTNYLVFFEANCSLFYAKSTNLCTKSWLKVRTRICPLNIFELLLLTFIFDPYLILYFIKMK